MKTIGTISIVVLLLGVSGSTARAQDDCQSFDRARGECSPQTQAPTRAVLLDAIRSGTPTRLRAMLEHAEGLDCYECVPAAVERTLTDGDAEMREFSAWWLRRRHFTASHVFQQFRSILQGSFPAWTARLDVPETVMRARAAEALGEFMDPAALAPLSEAAATDREVLVREAAVRALGRLNHPGGNAVLAAAMGDSASEVRRAALGSVLLVNFFREHDALVGTLADDDTLVRRQGALLVGQLRVTSSVTALAGLLRGDAEASVRRAAAWALGRIGGAEARAALAEAQATEADEMVQNAIEIALRR